MRSESIQDASANAYEISADPKRLDLDVIHGFLTEAYWSKGRSRATTARAVANSLCIGAYRGGAQVGFGRVITDYATFAHLCDVFVLPDHRGQGLARRMVAALLADARVAGIRRWQLNTEDMHDFYKSFGFGSPANSRWLMVRLTDA
jgi:GNAT superfamily N-acetyltransferase